jgi:hypothetical protein
MAKGLRASSRKKNSQALRTRLYGPAADARAERLSTKLQELAAKPRPEQERLMEVDDAQSKQEPAAPEKKDEGQLPVSDAVDDHANAKIEMEVDSDDGLAKIAKKSSGKKSMGRTQKKIAKRKAKKSVVFPDIKAKWRKQSAPKKSR